jgi:UDP-glucuronate 4-epimerase
MRFLVTGTAGFIGFHLARRLISAGHVVNGVDGMTPYYDIELKKKRHAMLAAQSNAFQAHVAMLEDMDAMTRVMQASAPDVVIHLAAQAGVRYSLENPRAFVDSNLVGTFNLMELVRQSQVGHFLLASTSSVYGSTEKMPLRETDTTDYPLTLYAASKKATEVLSHSYAHLWKIPTTAFRFFNVYGTWGRPDLALFKFVKAALADETIDVYGYGRMRRDFTYVDDLVEAIARLVDCVPVEGQPVGAMDTLSSVAPFRTVNIGGGQPVELMEFIAEIERCMGVTIRKTMMPMQKGDVPQTHAAPDLLVALTGYKPSTTVATGIRAFVDWYRKHYA